MTENEAKKTMSHFEQYQYESKAIQEILAQLHGKTYLAWQDVPAYRKFECLMDWILEGFRDQIVPLVYQPEPAFEDLPTYAQFLHKRDLTGQLAPKFMYYKVLPFQKTLNNTVLDTSNFEMVVEDLTQVQGVFKIVRCYDLQDRWTDLILVNPNSAVTVTLAKRLLNEFYRYTVLDTDHYVELLRQRALAKWRTMGISERGAWIRHNRSRFHIEDGDWESIRRNLLGIDFDGLEDDLLGE